MAIPQSYIDVKCKKAKLTWGKRVVVVSLVNAFNVMQQETNLMEKDTNGKGTRNVCWCYRISLQHKKAPPCFRHTEKLFSSDTHQYQYEMSDNDQKVNCIWLYILVHLLVVV